MILRHSHAMSGSAGLSPSRSRKQESFISSEHARSLSKENADHVVGPVALIVEIIEALRGTLVKLVQQNETVKPPKHSARPLGDKPDAGHPHYVLNNSP